MPLKSFTSTYLQCDTKLINTYADGELPLYLLILDARNEILNGYKNSPYHTNQRVIRLYGGIIFENFSTRFIPFLLYIRNKSSRLIGAMRW